MRKAELFFNTICYLATFSLLGFCLYIFCKDEDISEVIYRKYGDNSASLYPSFSFCVKQEEHSVDKDMLRSYGKELNASSYLSHLIGSFENDEMHNISYNDVTKSLLGHLVYAKAFDSYDADEMIGIKLERIHEISFPLSNMRQMARCITFDLPNTGSNKLQFVSIAIRQKIFPNQIRPNVGNLFVCIHHPNKFYRPIIAAKYNWPKRNKNDSNHYAMEFSIKSMEVLHRRDKTSEPCQEYNNYDDVFKEKLVEKIGCYPPYWSYDGKIPRCRTSEKLKMFTKAILKAITGILDISEFIAQPCIDLRKLMFDYEEFEVSSEEMKQVLPKMNTSHENRLMVINLSFLDPYLKVIKQTRSFGIESLIGNIGGYMGLLLGVSIIQLPRFCSHLYEIILNRNKDNETIENKNKNIDEPV